VSFQKKIAIIFLILSFLGLKNPRALDLNLWIDYSSFIYNPDTTKSYIEIYYALDRKQLDFYPQKEGAFASVVELNLTLEDSLNQMVEKKNWKVATSVSDLREAKEKEFLIIDLIPILLSPGEFSLKLEASDLNSGAVGEKGITLNVPGYNKKELVMSQIELAFQIEPDTGSGKFVKGMRRVMPNPTLVWGKKESMLYFYTEIYNLVTSEEMDDRYTLSFFVLDSLGQKFKSFGSQTLEKPGGSSVVTSGINIATLPGGDFYLKIEALDLATGKKTFSLKGFRTVKEVKEKPLSSEEALRIRDEISYIATKEELDLYDQLNLLGKKGFLTEFWEKRDPYLETSENEFRIEHYRRWNYANQMFSRTSKSKDGWKTDMGRVHIKYGEPDEKERNPHGTESKPWEKWNYHKIEEDLLHRKQSGVFFVFVDEDGFGVYRLIHSNAVGEISDPDWYQRIRLDTPQR